MDDATLTTARLVLRPWEERDREAFFVLNTDQRIMEWIGEPHTREQSDRLLERFRAHHAECGFSPWCLELDGTAIGWAGLFTPAFRPEIEIGWRVLPDFWSQGYATEAARAALSDGFGRHGLGEVISFTAAINVRSQAVMKRLGLRHVVDGGFRHPSLAPDHPLSQHVMYDLTAERYFASRRYDP